MSLRRTSQQNRREGAANDQAFSRWMSNVQMDIVETWLSITSFTGAEGPFLVRQRWQTWQDLRQHYEAMIFGRIQLRTPALRELRQAATQAWVEMLPTAKCRPKGLKTTALQSAWKSAPERARGAVAS